MPFSVPTAGLLPAPAVVPLPGSRATMPAPTALCHFQSQRPSAPTAMPLPAPTAVPLPTPRAMPLPAPTAVPLPTPGALPVPLVPIPMPTAVPLPTPAAVMPRPESAAMPFPAFGCGPNDPYWGVGVCLSRHRRRSLACHFRSHGAWPGCCATSSANGRAASSAPTAVPLPVSAAVPLPAIDYAAHGRQLRATGTPQLELWPTHFATQAPPTTDQGRRARVSLRRSPPLCNGARTAIPPAVRKQCGSSAEAVRKQCGSSSKKLRKQCGGNAERLRR